MLYRSTGLDAAQTLQDHRSFGHALTGVEIGGCIQSMEIIAAVVEL